MTISVFSLIAANLTPLFGILFLGWNLFDILFLYWLESAVLGVYNIIKFIVVGKFFALLMVPFFIFHYGMFMAGHLVFLILLFAPEYLDFNFFPSPQTLLVLVLPVWLPLCSLVVSHGISFITHFIVEKEYKQTDMAKLMTKPYTRIVLMHLTIIFGGWLILIFHQPVLGLVFLVALKSWADLWSHVREHNLKQPQLARLVP